MPIKKPSTQSKDSVNTVSLQGIDTVNDNAAAAFINRTKEKVEETPPPKPKRKAKVQMMMRIDEDLLSEIDQRAAEQKTSRSAWISRICAYGIKNDM